MNKILKDIFYAIPLAAIVIAIFGAFCVTLHYAPSIVGGMVALMVFSYWVGCAAEHFWGP